MKEVVKISNEPGILSHNNILYIYLSECKSCCNANGQCMDGVCSCKASFSGDDCGE